MSGAPPVEAEEARERRHLSWVVALARWGKAWAERVLAEHAAALAKAEEELGGAQVRSLPLREPVVMPPPVPAWPPRPDLSSDVTRMPPVLSAVPPLPPHLMDEGAPTPRPNTLRCVSLEEGEAELPVHVALGPLLDFDPDDLLPSEPQPAPLLQAAAIPCDDVAEAPALGDAQVAPRSLHVVPPLPGQSARDLLALLKESEGTPTRPSVPWPESTPPTPPESAEAEEMLRECERLEWETQGE
ncbi:hypothetical protein [Corallococcus llansteffanensis]|uniref:Uncharacterized protein n=1 Tax=Corallococcus llansteffanensis TaxID=2316731 RepID=A0A3A8P548_9BACT|nr:hypothetical protein [Corallococcus llansteffanensis]RKH50989.1 hypothetical protein D7V93_29810 [Corallococcus llansteffanensis]